MYQYLTRKFDDDNDDLRISIKREMYPKHVKPPSYAEVERTLASTMGYLE